MKFKRTPEPPEKPEPPPEPENVVSLAEWERRAKARKESLADLVFDRPWDRPAA